ncbi:MAG: hypothetical protein K0Q51_276 [Rickettsiaceae bacterium]|jgi:hypothetical protein|nr:hypothetical protein [Rickettsiaceae bacterium]
MSKKKYSELESKVNEDFLRKLDKTANPFLKAIKNIFEKVVSLVNMAKSYFTGKFKNKQKKGTAGSRSSEAQASPNRANRQNLSNNLLTEKGTTVPLKEMSPSLLKNAEKFKQVGKNWGNREQSKRSSAIGKNQISQ